MAGSGATENKCHVLSTAIVTKIKHGDIFFKQVQLLINKHIVYTNQKLTQPTFAAMF